MKKLLLILGVTLFCLINFGHPKHETRGNHQTEMKHNQDRGEYKKTTSIYVGHLISDFKG